MWFAAEFRRSGLAGLGVIFCLAAAGAFGAGEHGSHNKQADALFARTGFLQIEIEIAPEEVAILQSYRRRPANWERSNVVAVVREGGVVYSNVFLHLKGSAGSFQPFDSKPGLTLTFDKEDTEQRFHGLSKISLNNSFQDQSYLCEKIGREMFAAAGIPVPRASHAIVELNGRRLGLFVLVEGWTKHFLKRHFEDATGNLYERGMGNDINDRFDVKSGDMPEDRTMLDLLAVATQQDAAHRLGEMDRVLDLDRFITFMTMEVMIGHWDGYCLNRNNYRIFHDRAADKLVFMPHGMDQLFGMRGFGRLPDGTIFPQMRGMVASAVMQTSSGRQRYVERISYLTTNIFHAVALSNRVAELAANLRPAFTNTFVSPPVEGRGRRLGEFPTTLARFDAAVSQLQTRIAGRAASVHEQLGQFTRPIEFGSSRMRDLTGWEWKRDYGSAAFPPRRMVEGDEVMEINITGTGTVASWRTTLLLAPGEYQFHGLARMERLIRPRNSRIIDRGAICFRTSEDSTSLTVTNPPCWIAFTNSFTVQTAKHVEFICEFSGTRGKAQFDIGSLKLRQLSRSDASPLTNTRR